MTARTRIVAAAAAGAALLVHAQPSRAEQAYQRVITSVTDTLRTAVDLLPSDISHVRLGLGPGVSTDYEGGKHYHFRAIPVVSLKFRDLVEVNNNEVDVIALDRIFQADANMGGKSRLRVGPLISIDFGRSPGDAPELAGTPKVKTSFEFGAFAAYNIGDNHLRATIRQDVANGHKGMKVGLSLNRALLRGDNFTLGGNINSTWVNGNYMRSYFGIKDAASTATGYPVYRPTSGFKDVGAGLSANYVYNDNWSFVAGVSYERLIGKAADSPLVSLVGSKNQFSATTFAIYTF